MFLIFICLNNQVISQYNFEILLLIHIRNCLIRIPTMIIDANVMYRNFFNDCTSSELRSMLNISWKINVPISFRISSMSPLLVHSSEKRGLCLMKWPGEMLQNLPYFIYMKTQSCFFHFSFRATSYFFIMNALVYVIDQGIH